LWFNNKSIKNKSNGNNKRIGIGIGGGIVWDRKLKTLANYFRFKKLKTSFREPYNFWQKS